MHSYDETVGSQPSYPIPAPTPPQDGYTLYRLMAIPYNARARNVRACPRARARGMNPRWRFGTLF